MGIPPLPESALEVPPDLLSYHPCSRPSQAPFLLPRVDRIWYKYMFRGGMAERLKAAVLKTAGRQRPAGSNPAPSATPLRSKAWDHLRAFELRRASQGSKAWDHLRAFELRRGATT